MQQFPREGVQLRRSRVYAQMDTTSGALPPDPFPRRADTEIAQQALKQTTPIGLRIA
jgi:hypothetical protein